MGNPTLTLHQIYLDKFSQNIDDALSSGQGGYPKLVRELKKKHPNINLEELLLLTASAWAVLDTIEESSKPK